MFKVVELTGPNGLADFLKSIGFEGVEMPGATAANQEPRAEGDAQSDQGVEAQPKSELDSLAVPILNTLANLIEQRDEARQVAEAENAAHLSCHEGMEEYAANLRALSWAQADFQAQLTQNATLLWKDIGESMQRALVKRAAAQIFAFDKANAS